jgi:hypothetical protein
MNMIENELFQVIVRDMKRRIEHDVIEEIRSIRLELQLLSNQDRIAELEASEWARLDPVE